MLLAEWTRKVGEEKSLIDDSAQYQQSVSQAQETLGTGQNTNSTTYVLLWSVTASPPSGRRAALKYVVGRVSVTTGGTWYIKITAQAGAGSEVTLVEQSGTSATNVGLNTDFAGKINEAVAVRFYCKSSSSSYTVTLVATNSYVQYCFPGPYLLKDYGSIVLSEASLIAFSYDAVITAGGYGNAYIEVGSLRFGGGGVSNGETKTFSGVISLQAGSYSVKAYGYAHMGAGTSATVSVKSMRLGAVKFSDTSRVNMQQYSSSLSISLGSRKTCIGRTISGNCIVYVHAYADGISIAFADPGETPDNRVTIKVNGEQKAWTVKNQDSGNGGARGLGSAALMVQLDLDAQHTVAIEKSSQDITVLISVVFSPWLLAADDSSPVTLEFPTGSTLYVMAEPLITDVTKSIKIGRKRAVSFGGGTDYYVAEEGTGVISLAYTFDYLPTGEPLLAAAGSGACISLIGVDVRG